MPLGAAVVHTSAVVPTSEYRIEQTRAPHNLRMPGWIRAFSILPPSCHRESVPAMYVPASNLCLLCLLHVCELVVGVAAKRIQFLVPKVSSLHRAGYLPVSYHAQVVALKGGYTCLLGALEFSLA